MTRRVLPLLVLSLLLALPSLADAFSRPKPPPPGARGAGTLEITDGRGVVMLKMRGSVIGFVQRGRVIVKRGQEGDAKTYSGRHIRFRAVDGAYRILIRGVGIDLSAAGRGSVMLLADRHGNPGEFSLNGEDPQPLPRRATTLQLSAP